MFGWPQFGPSPFTTATVPCSTRAETTGAMFGSAQSHTVAMLLRVPDLTMRSGVLPSGLRSRAAFVGRGAVVEPAAVADDAARANATRLAATGRPPRMRTTARRALPEASA